MALAVEIIHSSNNILSKLACAYIFNVFLFVFKPYGFVLVDFMQ